MGLQRSLNPTLRLCSSPGSLCGPTVWRMPRSLQVGGRQILDLRHGLISAAQSLRSNVGCLWRVAQHAEGPKCQTPQLPSNSCALSHYRALRPPLTRFRACCAWVQGGRHARRLALRLAVWRGRQKLSSAGHMAQARSRQGSVPRQNLSAAAARHALPRRRLRWLRGGHAGAPRRRQQCLGGRQHRRAAGPARHRQCGA